MTENNDSQTTTDNKTTLPKHEAKLITARARLPELSPLLLNTFGELIVLSTNDRDALSQHLALSVREDRTRAAVNVQTKVGQTVKVVSGPHALIGKVGTVVKSNRIRCYVELDGKQEYLYTADVELIADVEGIAAPADVLEEQPVSAVG